MRSAGLLESVEDQAEPEFELALALAVAQGHARGKIVVNVVAD
jgi:hypothetical protein